MLAQLEKVSVHKKYIYKRILGATIKSMSISDLLDAFSGPLLIGAFTWLSASFDETWRWHCDGFFSEFAKWRSPPRPRHVIATPNSNNLGT